MSFRRDLVPIRVFLLRSRIIIALVYRQGKSIRTLERVERRVYLDRRDKNDISIECEISANESNRIGKRSTAGLF